MQIASVLLLLSCLMTTQRQDRRPAVASAFTVVESPSEIRMAMVPKFANLLVFEQAYGGAVQAYEELSSKGELQYIPPETPTDSGAAQIDFISRATVSQFYNTILLSNNAGDGIAGAALDASNHGTSIVTWDSPIPSGKQGGEEFFVSQVDFDSTGRVMADMAKRILPQGGKVAILSAAREATNQNQWISAMIEVMNSDAEKYGSLELIDEIVYGNDDALVSFQMANYILDTYPVSLIMAPTSVGITQASRAVSERQLCDSIKVSGLGLPVEMLDHTLSGCAPVFALWSFVDLGYLTYYAAYRLKTGELAEVKDGAAFDAGRLGTKVLQRDPTRGNFDAYRVIMGDFTLYDRNNIERAVVNSALQNDLKGQQYTFEQRYIEKYKRKALAIIPKVTGMISFVFSAYIVYHVLFDPKRRRSLKNRLLVGISIHDMIADLFGFFLSTWPMPADTWLVYGAVGTTQSCTMQGFFFQAGIGAAPLYSAALTTFYLLNVVFNMSPENIAKHAGKWLHGIPILFGWGTAIAGLPLNLYNAADRVGFMCWIAEFPTYCSLRGNCERGQNAGAYRWAFLYSWVFAVFLYMTICMFWIYCKVLKTEKATDRWTKASGQHPRRAMSHKVSIELTYGSCLVLFR